MRASLGRVDQHPVRPEAPRIPRIDHPADYGWEHDQDSDAHEHILVPETPRISVGDGPGRIFPRDHVFIGLLQAAARDIELRAVLAGKRQSHAVFAKGAAAHGKTHPAAMQLLQMFGSALQGLMHILWKFCRDDEGLQVMADFVEHFHVVEVGRLELLIDSLGQFVLAHEELIRMRGEHEPVRNTHSQPGLDFSKDGHFASCPKKIFFGQVLQGHGQRSGLHIRFGLQHVVDGLLNVLKRLAQLAMTARGNGFQ